MSEARNVSPRPNPTTTLPAPSLAATTSWGYALESTATAYAPRSSVSAARQASRRSPPERSRASRRCAMTSVSVSERKRCPSARSRSLISA